VLVVGTGCSGMEIAGDLAPYGLTLPDEGTFAALRRDDSQPTIVDPDVIESIKAGRIEIVAGVSSVDANGVQLSDGTVLWPDAVIAATGFSTGLEPLVGHLSVLDDEGLPCGSYGPASAAGLHFLGYEKGVGVIGPRAYRATRNWAGSWLAEGEAGLAQNGIGTRAKKPGPEFSHNWPRPSVARRAAGTAGGVLRWPW